MIGGDAGGEVGLQVSAAQAAGVAFNQFAAVETGWTISCIRSLPCSTPCISITSATPRTSGQPSMVSISAPAKSAPDISRPGVEGTLDGAATITCSGRWRLASTA